jgi:hypothetical protein
MVDPHLLILIKNDFAVTSLKEYGQFLSQPRDLSELKGIEKRAKKAIQFMKKNIGCNSV